LAGAMMGIFLFIIASRASLGSTQLPVQWVLGALTPSVKWLGHGANHSPLPTAEVKNVWSYTSTSLVHLHSTVLN